MLCLVQKGATSTLLKILEAGKTLKNGRVAFVRTDVSEVHSASFIRVTRIGELGTTLGVTSNRRTLRRNNIVLTLYLFAACVGC
jgi:hypothetical protein